MIVYASRTGNVRYIVSKLDAESIEITDDNVDDLRLEQPFMLGTYSDLVGEIPPAVKKFMENNWKYCKGVFASGNVNFGHNLFCAAGIKLSEQYGIPLVRMIDTRGYEDDYKAIQKFYEESVINENLSGT